MTYEYNYIIFYHKDIVLLFISQKNLHMCFEMMGASMLTGLCDFFCHQKLL